MLTYLKKLFFFILGVTAFVAVILLFPVFLIIAFWVNKNWFDSVESISTMYKSIWFVLVEEKP